MVDDHLNEASHYRGSAQIDLGARLGTGVRLDGAHVGCGVVFHRRRPATDDHLHRLQAVLSLISQQQLAQGADAVLRRIEPGEAFLDGRGGLELALPLVGREVIDVAGVAGAHPARFSGRHTFLQPIKNPLMAGVGGSSRDQSLGGKASMAGGVSGAAESDTKM